MIFEWAVRKRLFRNINHAIWFLMSMWVLILTTAYYFYPGLKILILLPVAIHFVAFWQAVHIIYIKSQSSETLSKDCMWFNALMTIIYAGLFFTTRYIGG
jgi:hypothetical protein